jgi:hypothetical protein
MILLAITSMPGLFHVLRKGSKSKFLSVGENMVNESENGKKGSFFKRNPAVRAFWRFKKPFWN